jgi:tetratricopeptide (TPR) repeat protein
MPRSSRPSSRLFVDRLAEHVEMAAYHAERGEVWDKAVRYLRQAGVKAATRLAYPEALDYFERALAALERLPDGRERTVLAIDVHIDMGPVLMVVKGVAGTEVEAAYLRARELCERIDETRRLFPVLWGLWYVEHMRGNPDRARQMGERLLEVARENDDRDQLLEAHHSLWPILVERGEFARARTHIEQGYALYDPTKHRGLTFLYGDHDPGVCCRTIEAGRLWLTGFPDQALSAIEDAVRLARQGAHPHTMGRAICYAAVLHYWRGEIDAARARAARWWRSATSTASSRSSPWAPSCWPTSSPAPARGSPSSARSWPGYRPVASSPAVCFWRCWWPRHTAAPASRTGGSTSSPAR